MHWHRSSLTQHGKFANLGYEIFPLASMNSPDRAPDFLILSLVSFAVGNKTVITATVTGAAIFVSAYFDRLH